MYVCIYYIGSYSVLDVANISSLTKALKVTMVELYGVFKGDIHFLLFS